MYIYAYTYVYSYTHMYVYTCMNILVFIYMNTMNIHTYHSTGYMIYTEIFTHDTRKYTLTQTLYNTQTHTELLHMQINHITHRNVCVRVFGIHEFVCVCVSYKSMIYYQCHLPVATRGPRSERKEPDFYFTLHHEICVCAP